MRGAGVYKEAQEQRRLWTPAAIRPLAWWDPSALQLTTVSGAVSQLNDMSGNGWHAIATTSGKRPTLTTKNGLTALAFNGTSNILEHGCTTIVQCVISAGVKTSTANDRTLIGGKSSSNIGSYYLGASSTVSNAGFTIGMTDGTAATATATAALSGGVPCILCGYGTTPPSGGSVVSRPNGGSKTGTGSVSTAYKTPTGGGIGAGWYNGAIVDYWPGTFYEGLILSSVFLDDIYRLEGYLAWKWDLVSTLLPSHPYKNQPPLI